MDKIGMRSKKSCAAMPREGEGMQLASSEEEAAWKWHENQDSQLEEETLLGEKL